MTAQLILLDHDRWRRGLGGAPAGLNGQLDAGAYAGLDLSLAQWSASQFNGSSFTSTSFCEGAWTLCQFKGARFSGCDLSGAVLTQCVFNECCFEGCILEHMSLQSCVFTSCQWERLTLHGSRWTDVHLLQCQGHTIEGADLRGERVKWEGSRFKNMRLHQAHINLSMGC